MGRPDAEIAEVFAGDFYAHGVNLQPPGADTSRSRYKKAPRPGLRETSWAEAYSPSLPMASTGQPSRASMHLSMSSWAVG